MASSASRALTARASLGAAARRTLVSRPASPSGPVVVGNQLGLDLLERDVRVLELVAAGAAALGVAEDVGDRAAVLAFEACEQSEPLLDLLEAVGRSLDLEQVAAQLAGDVLGLVALRL